MKDYYAILGIEKSASAEEIRQAYRELAKTLHPDLNPRGAGMMALANEAYETLSDPKKRAVYDRGAKVKPFPVAPDQPIGTVNLSAIAKQFFPGIYGTAGPSLERFMREKGITPEAASVEQMLEAAGVLKKQKRSKRSA